MWITLALACGSTIAIDTGSTPDAGLANTPRDLLSDIG